mgnify:FL=1
MKRKLFIIFSTLVLIITLLFSFVFKDNKENNNKISKVEKLLSKPEGIQAYTLNGKKTDISYNDLIEGYEIDSITCKNGTIATYNKEDNSVSLSNIHMPDYCTMDFKLGTYIVTIDAGGGYFGTSTEIDDGFTDALSLSKGVSYPVYIGNTLNLTPNQKYMLSFDYWSLEGSTEFNVDLFPDSLPEIHPVATTTQQTMNWIFSSSSSDMTSSQIRYFNDRVVPNPQTIAIINKHLYKCDDCTLTYTKDVTKGNAYGDLNVPKRYGWDFLGWYLEDGTKIDSTSINNIKGNHTVTAKWSHHNYQVKLVGVNGTIEYAPIWYYMAGWEKAFTKLTANNGYTTNGATVSCTGSAGASISGDYLYLSNITEDQTCTVTFKKIAVPLYNQLLADNPTISTRTDFSTTFTNTNTGTLYKATESIAGGTAKDVYYFAGDAKNNWVKFGGFYWRIIRTNADGSIRMLYSGTSPDTTNGYIDKSAFNSSDDNSMYAGYMYGTSGTLASNRTNTNNSTIKGVVDTWYNNSLSSYTKYISTTAVYCNDREIGEGTYVAQKELNKNSDSMIAFVDINDTSNLIATPDFRYNFKFSANIRLLDNKQPTYNCTNIKDAFSGSNTEAKLTYPIGLMTADEVVYAGAKTNSWEGSSSTASVWYYLNSTEGSITGSTNWWTITPSISAKVSSTNNSIYAAYVDNASLYVPDVYLGSSPLNNLKAVRPVISIKQCALWSSGSGSYISPYEVNGGC